MLKSIVSVLPSDWCTLSGWPRFQEAHGKIKSVFSRSYCCYGNLLSHKIDSNFSAMIGQFFDTMIFALTDK